MKLVDEYRDAGAAHKLAAAIARRATRPWTLMEICGGQTHSIVKFGLDELLPKTLTLVHAGMALSVVDEEEAAAVFSYLRAMGEAADEAAPPAGPP